MAKILKVRTDDIINGRCDVCKKPIDEVHLNSLKIGNTKQIVHLIMCDKCIDKLSEVIIEREPADDEE